MTSKKNQNTTLTQLDKAKAALLELKENVTTKDREAAIEELGVSKPTVSRYLLGEATNLDTALRLIRFFRGRIDRRDKELAATI